MKFDSLIKAVYAEPFFETGLLLAGDVDPNDVRRQLSRWVEAGRVEQLRRGLYTLAPPHRKIEPHPFEVANHLRRGSYVSTHSALDHFGMIPERVERVTSVGRGRPRVWETPLGTYEIRHLDPKLMFGFEPMRVGNGREALVALPEKALLDLVYLQPWGDRFDFLESLRLQHLETLDLRRLHALAERSGKPKLRRAAMHIAELARLEAEEFEEL